MGFLIIFVLFIKACLISALLHSKVFGALIHAYFGCHNYTIKGLCCNGYTSLVSLFMTCYLFAGSSPGFHVLVRHGSHEQHHQHHHLMLHHPSTTGHGHHRPSSHRASPQIQQQYDPLSEHSYHVSLGDTDPHADDADHGSTSSERHMPLPNRSPHLVHHPTTHSEHFPHRHIVHLPHHVHVVHPSGHHINRGHIIPYHPQPHHHPDHHHPDHPDHHFHHPHHHGPRHPHLRGPIYPRGHPRHHPPPYHHEPIHPPP